MQFSLLNFNTLGTPFYAPNISQRYKKIANILSDGNFDIVCLQEVGTYYHVFLLKKYLKNYPYIIYKKSLFGPMGGLVIASKIPIESSTFIPFTTLGSLNNLSFYSALLKMGLLSVKIKDTNVTIFTTHTVTDFEFEWSPNNQFYRLVKAQIEQIAYEVSKYIDKGQSIILTGDFNIKKNSTLYKYLRNETKLMDIFGNESFPTYNKERLNYKFKGKTSERIDFMFVKEAKQKLKVISTSHLFNKEETIAKGKKSYLSDHIALQATLKLL